MNLSFSFLFFDVMLRCYMTNSRSLSRFPHALLVYRSRSYARASARWVPVLGLISDHISLALTQPLSPTKAPYSTYPFPTLPYHMSTVTLTRHDITPAHHLDGRDGSFRSFWHTSPNSCAVLKRFEAHFLSVSIPLSHNTICLSAYLHKPRTRTNLYPLSSRSA